MPRTRSWCGERLRRPSTRAGTADVGAGIAGNGEVAIRLFLDASATTQSGYRVYLFYP